MWNRLLDLLDHAKEIPEANDLRTQVGSLREGRLLLDGTDRTTPLLKKAAGLLRSAVTTAHGHFKETFEKERKRLEGSEAWQRISEADRILAEEGIGSIPAVNIGSNEELLQSLKSTPLPSWREKTDALSKRFDDAAMKAAVLLQPKVQKISFERVTLQNTEEVKAWVVKQEARLVGMVKDGPIVIG